MTDIETIVTAHLRSKAEEATPVADIDSVTNGRVRRDTSASSERPNRTVALVAAASVLVVGAGGLLWVQGSRDETATAPPAEAPVNSSGRTSGSIDDPRVIDFSPWVDHALPWPTGQPSEYLVFDIAALDGWTQLDQTGGHGIGDGPSYHWDSNLSDPEARQFHVTISNSADYPVEVSSGAAVDINGVTGTLGEGVVSWPLDDTHTATATEFGTTDTERVLALVRRLTTTTVPSISAQDPVISTGVRVDPDAAFAGTVDGVAWSISGTPDDVTVVIDDVVWNTLGDRLVDLGVQIGELGSNDFCVFVDGVVLDPDATIQLVLSDSTTIGLPTRAVTGGRWFGACLPYALDAVALDVTAADGSQPVRYPLHSPYLRPTIGGIQSAGNEQMIGTTTAVSTSSDPAVDQASTSEPEEVMQSDGPDWVDVSTPAALVDLAEVVVVAEPLTTEESVVREDQSTENVVNQYRAVDVRVVDVLAGDGVEVGDTLSVARGVTRVYFTVNGAGSWRTMVGGGYAGALTDRRYILGLVRDPVIDETLSTWGIVAGARGLVALDGADGDERVANPAQGHDGQLQTRYAGQPAEALINELRAG